MFPMDVFIIVQLSRSVRLPCKLFLGENKGKKTRTLQETQADQIFHIINIGNFRCTSEGFLINQSWSMQFPVATFSKLAVFGSWTTFYVSARYEKVGHM